MSRLPVSGQDQGTWGDILNDFLLVSHASDGSLGDFTANTVKGAVVNAPADANAAHVGLTIKLAPNSNAATQAFQVQDANGVIICTVGSTGGFAVLGDHNSATPGIFLPQVSLDGSINPPALQYSTNGGSSGNRIWFGLSGTPTSTLAAMTCLAGDMYFRVDTPSTANQRIYICISGGKPGSWSGIV